MQTLKNLLKTFLPINVGHSPNIKRKSQVNATKTLNTVLRKTHLNLGNRILQNFFGVD